MIVEKFPLSMDLNESSLDYARAQLGADHIHQIHVFASRSNAFRARRVQATNGFELTIVPDYFLASIHAWGAEFAGKAIWTEGMI